MGLQSLRDKLLQAGLVTEDQAKKAEADLETRKRAPGRDDRENHARPAGRGPQGRGPQGRAERGGRPAGGRPQQQQARPQQPQQPKRELTEEEKRQREEEAAYREKERMLAREREENRKRAVEDRKKLETLRELAEKYEVTERGDDAFFFTSRKKKVLKIFLSPTQLSQLEAGELAIIDKPLPGEIAFALVTREGAMRAVNVDSRAVRFFNKGFGETYGFKAEAPLPGEEPAAESEATDTTTEAEAHEPAVAEVAAHAAMAAGAAGAETAAQLMPGAEETEHEG